MSLVRIDKKGRAVLKKDLLNNARVNTPCTMIAHVKQDGVIELKTIEEQLAKATAIGSKKLKGWREEDHAEEKLLEKMIKREID